MGKGGCRIPGPSLGSRGTHGWATRGTLRRFMGVLGLGVPMGFSGLNVESSGFV